MFNFFWHVTTFRGDLGGEYDHPTTQPPLAVNMRGGSVGGLHWAWCRCAGNAHLCQRSKPWRHQRGGVVGAISWSEYNTTQYNTIQYNTIHTRARARKPLIKGQETVLIGRKKEDMRALIVGGTKIFSFHIGMS